MRSILYILLYGALSSLAQADWTVENNGCKVWTSEAKNQAGILVIVAKTGTLVWHGECQDGFAEGKGKLFWTTPDQFKPWYDGEMRAGKREGQGFFVHGELGSFSGIWKHDDLPHGAFRSPNETTTYSGGLANGLYHGEGTHSSGGTITRGKWEKGQLVETYEISKSRPTVIGGRALQGQTQIFPRKPAAVPITGSAPTN